MHDLKVSTENAFTRMSLVIIHVTPVTKPAFRKQLPSPSSGSICPYEAGRLSVVRCWVTIRAGLYPRPLPYPCGASATNVHRTKNILLCRHNIWPHAWLLSKM